MAETIGSRAELTEGSEKLDLIFCSVTRFFLVFEQVTLSFWISVPHLYCMKYAHEKLKGKGRKKGKLSLCYCVLAENTQFLTAAAEYKTVYLSMQQRKKTINKD